MAAAGVGGTDRPDWSWGTRALGGGGADPTRMGALVGMRWIHDTRGTCPECLGGHESFRQRQRANGFDIHGVPGTCREPT